MQSKVTTKPAIEPVTLAEVKASLRITSAAEDDLISQFITDARVWCENVTGKKFITQTITAYYDGTSGTMGPWWDGTKVGAVQGLYGSQCVPMEHGPCQSITSLETIDQSNTETLVASSIYYLDNYDDYERPKLRLNDGSTLSNNFRSRNSIKMVYVAGYGDDAVDVPADIRRAIVLLAGKLYANRGDCNGECADNCGATGLLSAYTYSDTQGLT